MIRAMKTAAPSRWWCNIVKELCRLCRGQIGDRDSWTSGVAASIRIFPSEAMTLGRCRRWSRPFVDLIQKWCYWKTLRPACMTKAFVGGEASAVQTCIGGSDLCPGLWRYARHSPCCDSRWRSCRSLMFSLGYYPISS